MRRLSGYAGDSGGGVGPVCQKLTSSRLQPPSAHVEKDGPALFSCVAVVDVPRAEAKPVTGAGIYIEPVVSPPRYKFGPQCRNNICGHGRIGFGKSEITFGPDVQIGREHV